MEETWELAALVMSDDDGNETWDWSTRQVRLKTEMFLSSFTFLLLGLFEIKGLKFTPVTFSEGKGPEQWMLWLFFLAVAIYFTVSFYLRSQADLNGQAGGALSAVSKMESVVKSDNALVKKLSNLETKNLEEILAELEALNSDLENISSAYSINKKDFFDEFGGVLNFLENEIPDFQRLSLLEGSRDFETGNKNQNFSVEKLKAVKNGELFVELVNRLQVTNDISNDFNNIHNKIVGFKGAVSAYGKFIKNYDITEVLKQNLELKTATKKYLQNMNAVNKSDKILMSYQVPFYLSLSFIFVSTVWFLLRIC